MTLRKRNEKSSSRQIALSRTLRRSATDAESLLWYHLRSRRFNAKFRRQHPLGPYILDFVSIDHRLVVELDGTQHYTSDGVVADAERTAFLESRGLRVLRFTNVDLLTETESVLESIQRAPSEPPP